MAIQYQGLFGETYLVGEKIAGGGEGAIHKIQGDEFHVAKIFKPERRDQQREMKLCRMVQTRLTEDQLEEVTWPQDVIYSKEGFVGYIMPKLMNTESLTSIYSAGTNSKYDLRWRILAAINLCHAVQTIHNMGQVCGDLNPQNICVNLNMNDKENAFHITLVDTDSYHFTAEGKTYRCEVGLADYIAPEVQKKMTGGMSLRSIPLPTYTKETDLFALAVHIFALLMNGCHPFACAKAVNGALENTMKQMESSDIRDSVAAPQPIENIRDGFFPFYEKHPGITHPVYAPSFDALPAELQNLFVRTFVDGYADPSKRVDTGEWIDVLMKYNASVVCCAKKPDHYYYGHRAKCPLCEVDERMDGMVDPGPKPIPDPVPVPPDPPKPPAKKKHFSFRNKVACVFLIMFIIEHICRIFNIYPLATICREIDTVASYFSDDTNLDDSQESASFSGDPWELSADVVNCPDFGASLKIPQGATVEDDSDEIRIILPEIIGKVGEDIHIYADEALRYSDADGNGKIAQTSFDSKPSKKLKKELEEGYADDESYSLVTCEYKQINNRWYTIVILQDDQHKYLELFTSNSSICYVTVLAIDKEKDSSRYVALLEKVAGTFEKYGDE